MQFRASTLNAVVVGILAITLFFSSLISPNEAWAKHKKAKSNSAATSDPCAEPTTFVKDHIAEIRALLDPNAEHTKTSVYGLFSSYPNMSDAQDTRIKIAELRHDADGVNELLRTSECKPLDIDKEIRTRAGSQTATTAEVRTKRR